jgi:hypothetical protein
VARRERRDGPPDRQERDYDRQEADGDFGDNERESLIALKGILMKVAGLLRPLGLSPEEAVNLVERLYESIIEMDMRLAGESDESRREQILQHVQTATIRREDDLLVIDYSQN